VNDYALPASSPSVQGVEAEGVQALLDALEGTPGVEPHSIMLLRHGYVVAAGWWRPYSPARPQLLYSLSKSFTSTAAGLAASDGVLDLERTVVSYFPELDREVTDPRSRSMLVRHIASMASGHLEDTWGRVVAKGPAEPVAEFLRIPPDRAPGSVFAYNQSCTYTLAAIVQRLTGDTLTSYLQKKLPSVFGESELRWLQDSAGRDLGFSGLHANTESVARLGLLYLARGTWSGEDVLDAHWVDMATSVQIPTKGSNMAGVDWEQGYGYQFWRSRHGYRGDGAYGQFCLVLPQHDAVVAITSQSSDMQAVLDAVWENLLPALLDGPVTESGADARLRDRLAQLSVPPLVADALPPAGGQQVWVDATFAPEGGTCAQQPSLAEVALTTDEGGWRVTLREAAWSTSVPMGTGTWAVWEGPPATAGGASTTPAGGRPRHQGSAQREVVPVACMGGWVDASTLRIDAIFLETPHRLSVTCRIPERTFEASWVTAPLHAPSLADLRAPA
jgi:CubicO group peptidase (beta-lactamase class C family)